MNEHETGLLMMPPFVAGSGREHRSGAGQGGPAWNALAPRVLDRPFLRSEGTVAPLGPPRLAAPWLVQQSRRVVQTFHRFYRAVVDAEGALAASPARQIGEPYERIARAEGDRDPVPLGRFDCVLSADGQVRVIELNPIGVCTLHLRAVSYLARALDREARATREVGTAGALRDAALEVDQLRTLKTQSMRHFCQQTLARPAGEGARVRLCILRLPNMHRGSLVFWRSELTRAGFDVIDAVPTELSFRANGASVRGQRVDALWADWAIYLGYQQRRYEQTRFASKVGDYSRAGVMAEQLLSDPALPALLSDRALTLLSPMRAYRALSKGLLALIHRDGSSPNVPGVVIDESDRAFLRDHVARTYDDHDRRTDVIDLTRARAERETLVLKPCRFGGSHGVTIGREIADEAWARRLDETWADPEWVLQEMHEPVRDGGATGSGPRLSYGLYDYGGELGGILVRSAPEFVVSARTAAVIPAVIPTMTA